MNKQISMNKIKNLYKLQSYNRKIKKFINKKII